MTDRNATGARRYPGLDPDLQRRFYEMLVDSQWWSADALQNYQRSQLGQLVRHAKANVPFYRHRLDALFAPNGDVNWDRWSEIPIVVREDLHSRRAAMQTLEYVPGHGAVAVSFTSGSTGLPIEITINQLVHLANAASRWRCHNWHSLDWGRNFCSWILSADKVGGWPEGTNLGLWGPPWDDVAQKGRGWAIEWGETATHVADFIRRHSCAYLNRGPKAAFALAVEAERLGLEIKLDVILTQGEACGLAERAAFKRAFGATVIEHYSSKEAGQIAHPCELGVLHVNEETHFVEVVDDQGRPCNDGMSGRLIVTPLYLTAQPLVRYDQGDIAELGSSCACGRKSLTIAKIYGRSLAVFRHPSGETVCRFMPETSRELIGAGIWQIAQTGPLDFEVRFIEVQKPQPDGAQQFVEMFKKLYWPDLRLTLRQTTSIAPGPSGKHAEYVNEWFG
jgi:phenylacetate-CoA ligase